MHRSVNKWHYLVRGRKQKLKGKFLRTYPKGIVLWFYLFDCAGSSKLRRLFSSCSVWASPCSGLSWYGAQALGHAGQSWFSGSGARAEYLWCTVSVTLRHVGFSQIRDWTRVSCIGRQTLYHWVTREAQGIVLKDHVSTSLCKFPFCYVIFSCKF